MITSQVKNKVKNKGKTKPGRHTAKTHHTRTIEAITTIVKERLEKTKPFVDCKGNRVFYLDGNATTRPYDEVIKYMSELAQRYFGNPSSSHLLGKQAHEELVMCRMKICKYLGISDLSQLIFTSGATESNNLVSRGRIAHMGAKKHIVSSNIEHASVHVTLHDMVEHNLCTLNQIPVTNARGLIPTDALEKAIRSGDTVLVSIIVANNEIGTIQDTKKISSICRKYPKVHIHYDLTQMVGRYPLDFSKMDMDSASFSAHKFGGPRGIGGLYIRSHDSIDTIATGGLQENSVRAGTENLPSIGGMMIALKISLYRNDDPELDKDWQQMVYIKNAIMEKRRDWLQQKFLDEFPGKIVINGMPPRQRTDNRPAFCHRLYNTLNFSQAFIDSHTIVDKLKAKGVCVSVGSACSLQNGSKTLAAIGLSEALQKGTLRISLCDGTSCSDLKQAFGIIVNVLKEEMKRPINKNRKKSVRFLASSYDVS